MSLHFCSNVPHIKDWRLFDTNVHPELCIFCNPRTVCGDETVFLHLATDKADASALLNEVTRATGAESNLQTAIDTKADATALSNYVLTAALNKQIDTLNTAISAK